MYSTRIFVFNLYVVYQNTEKYLYFYCKIVRVPVFICVTNSSISKHTLIQLFIFHSNVVFSLIHAIFQGLWVILSL